MDIMQNIFARAKENPQRIAFPEATEKNILLACRECADQKLCIPYLVGDPAAINEAAKEYEVSLDGMVLTDSTDDAFLTELIRRYVKIMPLNSEKTMRRKSKDSLYVALMMESIGDVDCTFAGLSHTTGEVISAGQLVIGLKDGINVVSSVGLMSVPGFEGSEGEFIAYGDSAVCIDPDASDLAGIAIASCDTIHELLGWEPRCAMLSFSTDGSS